MNHPQTAHAIQLTRQLLDDGLTQLPHDITERLRFARMQALAQAKPQPVLQPSNGFFNWLQHMPSFTKSLVALPVLAMALLIGAQIHAPSTFEPKPMALMQASDTINIDAILNEQIPLQAYLNDDFNRFVAQQDRK